MVIPNALVVLGVCGVYMAVGPTLMIVNKSIMDHNSFHFPYPYFVSSMGLWFTTGVTQILVRTGHLQLEHQKTVTRDFWIRNIFPVGACHGATLAFGNAQYLYMGIAMVQFLKAFTPMAVTLFSVLLIGKRYSLAIWLSLVLACVGSSMTAVGDMTLHPFGLILAFGSSVTEAIRLVLTQYCLQNCKFSLLEGQYYLAPVAATCLLVLSFFQEMPTMYETDHYLKFLYSPSIFFVAGALGFGVQIITSKVIQVTSSVTVKVLSQLRNVMVVLSGVVFFQEELQGIQLFGYLISFVGISLYTYFQMQPEPQVQTQQKGNAKQFQPLQQLSPSKRKVADNIV